ncbi:patatin-like protein 3 [Triticum aestivum]|uniref:patatin-like protein 3 n=1 Tax=Triticum aestivum TaxID=4565 RepID=UPI001D03563A|nr:patatin-like protein 3 [Triticum aestivum]XP_044383123.1 patatin-like protein 3 [Triticum aestivum]XP_044383124.1 patatin-like protein 3 [Triticum aestivum]XP_044383125.1 patatin-like protein 3 [Triticum aestivum]XP_044383127.1 patatin-like protein 3 [Triticum aestivum]
MPSPSSSSRRHHRLRSSSPAPAPSFVFSRAGAVEAESFHFPLWQVCAAACGAFVFSRADVVEAEAFDFPLWQVCVTACGVGPAEVASLDGHTRLRAAAAAGRTGAGVANPTAMVVTHVLHNKHEFPFTAGTCDLVLLSLGGNAAAGSGARGRPPASCASPARARPTSDSAVNTSK